MSSERALNHLSGLKHTQIKTDDSSLSQYGRDWLDFYVPKPAAVLFPESTSQVQSIVQWANDWHIPLVPSGGRTGLSGGAAAQNQEVVVSLQRMTGCLEVKPAERSITVMAGTPLTELHTTADQYDLSYPVDLASKDSCQIGGNLATNAGGSLVIRYGHTRYWARGLTVISGQGERLELNHGLIKNATGYDLRQLMIGSEGTLGIITQATMALTNKPKPGPVILLAVAHIEDALVILTILQKQLVLLTFEFFSELALQFVLQHSEVARPVQRAPYYIVFQAEQPAESNQLYKAVETCHDQGYIIDDAVSQNDRQAAQLWQYRAGITEALAAYRPYKNDLAVKPSMLPRLLTDLEYWLTSKLADWQTVIFGHLADGNIHLNILKPDALPTQTFYLQCEQLMPELYQLIQSYGGTISAEHGIGLLKKPYLHYSRDLAERQYFRTIKHAFDPNWLLNPGKLFDR